MEGCSPWGRWGWDTIERLHFHFSLSCIGEGNGNPLQCSCLEIPGTREPDGLPSMGSHRVGYDWSDLAAAAAWYDTLGDLGISLEVQWLRIHLLMQVQSLVWKDPTCHGTTKPEHHSYWAARVWELPLLSPSATTIEACMCRACAPQLEKPPQWEVCALQ